MNARHFSTSIFIFLFLGTMFGGLFHIGMGMDMDMTNNTSGCPFMAEVETLCSMDVFEHLSAWQSVFTTTLTVSAVLLLLVGAAVGIASVAPHLLRKVLYADPPLLGSNRERLYAFSYRPLQELFARGILHPKLF